MHRPKVMQLPIRQLIVDPNVQRGLDRRRVTRIANELDVHALGVITVSQRPDGTYVVIDGQHRIEACKEAGRGELQVTARVYAGLTLPEEATLFRLLNNTAKPQFVDIFRVRVVEGEEVAVAVSQLAERYGWKVSVARTASGSLLAIQSLEAVFRKDPIAAERTMATITRAWGHDPAGTDGRIIAGLGLVYARYQDAVDVENLADRLARRGGGPNKLLGDARGLAELIHTTVARAMAEVLVELYNSRRKTKALPAWRS